MDTDDLSREAYEAIIIEAERFSHDLTLRFGVLSSKCQDESEFIEKSRKLAENILVLDDYEIEEKILNKYIFNFSKTKQKNAIKALKMMNVDNSKLFPGMEGLSKSLSLELTETKGVL